MNSTDSNLMQKTRLLKEARFQLLKLHKLLVDSERAVYEHRNGQVTSGQFLNVLINDNDFQWLKKFSNLIVEIDEMFDLDDGVSLEMIENYLSKMTELLDLDETDEDFKNKYTKVLQNNSEIQEKHQQLKIFLSKS
ncbi:MAG: hypothetical protein WKF90_04190 [Pyrinomonadaceae bacterium]|jgi:hypothetical protein